MKIDDIPEGGGWKLRDGYVIHLEIKMGTKRRS